jgi:thiol-disulfide isomerase/thioredoxin
LQVPVQRQAIIRGTLLYGNPLLEHLKCMALSQIRPLLVLTFSWTLTFSTVNGQNSKGGEYLISGTVKGVDSGTVRLLSVDGNSLLDSAGIAGGTFSMKGKIGMPERLLFNISPGNWNFRAFVEATSIKLLVDTTGARYQGKGTNKWALIWEIEETGSALANVYTQYKNATSEKDYTSVISSLREKYKAVKDNADTAASLSREMDSVNGLLLARQKLWIESYIKQYPSSIAGVYLFNEYFHTYQYYQTSPGITLSYLDSMLNKFSGTATTSRYYKELAEIAYNLRSIQHGNLAPDFTLLQRDRSKFTLSSTRGKYTLIDFWASWCVPCRRAIPLWKSLYAKYKNKEFAIVGISSDRRWNDWAKALDKEQMPWVQVIDKFPDENHPAVVTETFGANSLPFYVLLDKDGKVIVSSKDKDVVKEKIEEIFQ